MRIARFWLNDEARFGVVDGPELRILEGHPLVNGYEYTGDRVAMKEVKLLAPTVPSKIVCIGKNYAAHAAAHGILLEEEEWVELNKNYYQILMSYDNNNKIFTNTIEKLINN
jgi:2-keto-4-pentenoate hydratase/2-oxohepta-3-ene-1,7-dioic acid hydratase in catechol pathway